jgi:hypothetical protein
MRGPLSAPSPRRYAPGREEVLMRTTLRLLALGVTLSAVPDVAFAIGSDSCPSQWPELLLPGDYDGKFSTVIRYQGGEKLANQDWALRLDGTLRLTVDDDGKITHGSGSLDYSFGGFGVPAKGAPLVVGITSNGHCTLELKDQAAGQFQLKGELTGEFKPWAASDKGTMDKFEGAPHEEVTIRFLLDKAICGSKSGAFESEIMAGTSRVLSGRGFRVTPSEHSFFLSGPATEQADRELQEVDKKIEEALRASSREATEQQLAKVKQDIDKKKKKDPLRECLMGKYRTAIYRMVRKWLDEDVPALAGYSGDLAGLKPKMRKVVYDDSKLVEAGVDNCDEGLHKFAWDTVGQAYQDALERCYAERKEQPLLELREFYRGLLGGDVAPTMEDQDMQKLFKAAKDRRDKLLKELKKYAKKAKGGPADASRVPACNAALDQLLKDLRVADKQYFLLHGGKCSGDECYEQAQANDDLEGYVSAADYLGRLRPKDIQECDQQLRKKSVDDFQKTHPPK